jgi:hypothetical protein
MNHLFLNKKLSQLAKEKGFNEPCLAYYGDMEILYGNLWNGYAIEMGLPDNSFHVVCYAPLYQQIIDWFREKHAIIIHAHPKGLISYYGYVGRIGNMSNEKQFYDESWSGKSNYYQALDKAIEESFKLIL